MAEFDYEKSTIQLIAQKADLAPGLLHYHFKTKADILVELVKTLANLGHTRYLAFAEAASSADEQQRAYVNARLAMGEGADSRAVAAWVVIAAEAVRQPEVRSVYQQAVRAEMALIEGLLTACIKGRNKNLTVVTPLAASLLAMIEGAFQLASAAPGVTPAGSAATMAIDMVERYIQAG